MMHATVTTFGCKEWLRHIGLITEGELVYMPARRLLVSEIQAAVATYYGIPLAAMTSKSRVREFARPRQIAMTLARELTTISYPELGRRFGNRDHSTIVHGVHQITRLRTLNPEIDGDYRALRAKLERGA